MHVTAHMLPALDLCKNPFRVCFCGSLICLANNLLSALTNRTLQIIKAKTYTDYVIFIEDNFFKIRDKVGL